MPKGINEPPNRDMAHWNLRLRVVWADLYGTLEDYLDAKEVFELYTTFSELTPRRQKALRQAEL